VNRVGGNVLPTKDEQRLPVPERAGSVGRLAVRLCSGGAVLGAFVGAFAGALIGGGLGAIRGDLSLGLDGAVCGSLPAAFLGGCYGLTLAVRSRRRRTGPQ